MSVDFSPFIVSDLTAPSHVIPFFSCAQESEAREALVSAPQAYKEKDVVKAVDALCRLAAWDQEHRVTKVLATAVHSLALYRMMYVLHVIDCIAYELIE